MILSNFDINRRAVVLSLFIGQMSKILIKNIYDIIAMHTSVKRTASLLSMRRLAGLLFTYTRYTLPIYNCVSLCGHVPIIVPVP